jgi:hypothetical protein
VATTKTVTMLSRLSTMMQIITVRRRADRPEMASVAGMASRAATRAKAANIDLS